MAQCAPMAVTLDPQLPVSTPARAHRTALIVLSLVFLAGGLFVVLAALPYFALNEAQFDRYWPRRWWLLAHISTGIVALLSGPMQLWLGLSDQRPIPAEVSHLAHRLRTRCHLKIQRNLSTGNDLPRRIEQNAQLSIGMRRPQMRQDHHLAPILARDLHRHRARGRAHLPHVRHRPNLPA